jgi:hypothetical protein
MPSAGNPFMLHPQCCRFDSIDRLNAREKDCALKNTQQDGSSCALKLVSQSFLTSLTRFDALAPFGVENLVGGYAAAGVGVEDAVDDVPATSLS